MPAVERGLGTARGVGDSDRVRAQPYAAHRGLPESHASLLREQPLSAGIAHAPEIVHSRDELPRAPVGVPAGAAAPLEPATRADEQRAIPRRGALHPATCP